MKLSTLIERIQAKVLSLGNQDNIIGGYCGDFLSNVISAAPAGCAWFTVMNNVNVAGVALLAEVGAIVLCEGVEPSADLLVRCKEHNISLLVTTLDVFTAARAVGDFEVEDIL